jgi:prolyl oligopeptidase
MAAWFSHTGGDIMAEKSAYGPRTVPPPPPTRAEDLVEELHGTPVADPYRWLEKGDDPEVQAWIDAQNQRTRELLDALPSRQGLRRRIRELLSLTVISPPFPRGDRYIFTHRGPEQNQPEIRMRRGLDGPEEVLLDVNSLSPDGTTALDWMYPSPDGTLLAYGLSQSGSEESTLYVLETDTREKRPDVIPYTRHCSLAWLPDGSGFFYTRHPAPGDVPEGDETYYCRVFFHRLGGDWEADPLVFGEDRPKTDIPTVSISPDGEALVVNVLKGSADFSDVYLRTPAMDGPFVPIIENEAVISHAAVRDGQVYLKTNRDAPNYRIFRFPVRETGRDSWTEIVAERQGMTLDSFSLLGGRIFLHYIQNVSSRLVVCNADGGSAREIELPGIGSVAGIRGEWSGKEAFVSFTSFHVPLTVYRYDLPGEEISEFSRTAAPLDTDAFVIEQVWATSRDGTRVPMFVGRRKDREPDGTCPGLITGYGGFNIPLTPYYSLLQVLWMEAGGVAAVANLRGGSEFGEEWHRAGMLEKKQNVFDDFIACADHLVESKYVSRERLCIVGGSNGGLLVAAAMVQRPDLCRAVVCSVPVIDMLRYHRFLLARYWMGEYGDPENPEHFPFLYEYSPYHHVKDGTDYPAAMFRTAASDSRVDPMHAMKMAARVQAATSSDRPVLFWLKTKAGHGIGMPKDMIVDEVADEMSFLFWQLRMSMG